MKKGGIFWVLMAAVIVCGCVPAQPAQDKFVQAEKALLAGKRVIVATAIAADSLCSNKTVQQDQCDKMEEIYVKSHAAYVVAVDAVQVAAKKGDAESWQDFLSKQDIFDKLVDDAVKIQEVK